MRILRFNSNTPHEAAQSLATEDPEEIRFFDLVSDLYHGKLVGVAYMKQHHSLIGFRKTV